jgi:arginine-tRNA-protein transferase
MTVAKRKLRLFASQAHDCPYLPGRTDSAVFLDPEFPLEPALFQELIDLGFRRSGTLVYRPHCPACSACVSVRIPVREFRPDRSQRRALRVNRDLRVVARGVATDEEHFRLYRAYQAGRHPGSSMNHLDPEKYRAFLWAPFSDTALLEFRHGQRLLAVAVVDRLRAGLSAVYTYYDPGEARRSLGTYAILHLIERAREAGLDWVYLGYWIKGSRTMSYKIRFQPLEGFIDNRWRRIAPPA